MNVNDVIYSLRNASCICLDVDSTVCTDEGIDVLAEAAGCGQAVMDWTARAMGGKVTFEESFAARLDIIKPTRTLIDGIVAKGPNLTHGVKDFVRQLHEHGKDVYLVSGGIRDLVVPVADELSIPRSNVFANVLFFDESGNYIAFDNTQPTSHTGGKPQVVAHLKKQHNYSSVILIGDGVTDMEAKPPADVFIGFGGNVEREAVVQGSDIFVKSFQELSQLLD
eukprot:gene9606-1829_t